MHDGVRMAYLRYPSGREVTRVPMVNCVANFGHVKAGNYIATYWRGDDEYMIKVVIYEYVFTIRARGKFHDGSLPPGVHGKVQGKKRNEHARPSLF